MGSRLQKKTAPPERRRRAATGARPWRIVLAEAMLVSIWIIAVVRGTQAMDSKNLSTGMRKIKTNIIKLKDANKLRVHKLIMHSVNLI